jgi:putative DNA primase/helicase
MQEFAIRSAFLLSSIGVGLKEAADLTRTAVLTVRPLESYAPEERLKLEDNWKSLQNLSAMMPMDMPQKLLARQMMNMQALRANIDIFKQATSEMLNSPRIGDQLGTLLAGAHSLFSTNVLTVEQCKKYLEQKDLEEFTVVKNEREDVALLHHICGTMIRVETLRGPQERALGELIYHLLERPSEAEMNPLELEAVLGRHGLRLCMQDGRREGIWIGYKVPTLNRIMQTSDYFEGWAAVLARHPHARKSDTSMRFGGVISRAIYIPKPEWPLYETR